MEKIIDTPILFKHLSNKLEIYAGGNKNNLFFNGLDNDGWIISGIGLKAGEKSSVLFQSVDWSANLNNLNNIDGHFASIKWNKEELILETDPIGLRDFYISENTNEIIFSTRTDFLAKIHKLKIDFSEFGSRWFLFNQISNKSVFKNVERIVAGKKVSINLNSHKISYSENNWLPEEQKRDVGIEEFSERLKPYVFIGENQTLGLSGGIDSRILLSYLLSGHSSWNVFTFGDPNHPDNQISQILVNDFNIKHTRYYESLPSIEEIILIIKNYSIQSLVNNSASAIFQSLNYTSMHNEHSILIDGCLGEIWRREFFYRLYFNGKKFIINKNIAKIIPHITLLHADIFKKEVNDLMVSKFESQLNHWFEKIPPVETIGIENWIDLFAIKTRMPNYFLHEQNIIDSKVTSIMPFTQQSLLKLLFNIPISLRKNGKILRNIIKSNFPSLEKYPLVKGTSINPYNITSVQSRVLSKFKKVININPYHDKSKEQLYSILKPYIFDVILSENFKSSEIYDHKKVNNIIKGYYNGNPSNLYFLDWWLSFEFFRQNIEQI